MNNYNTESQRLKVFLCIIKSHCEAPDFDYEVEASNKDEAADKLLNIINQGNGEWDKSMILPYIEEWNG